MDIVKATPELLADYANFLFDFTRRPVTAIKSITARSEGAEPRVSGKLFLFLALSVGVSIVITYIGVAADMAPDNSGVVRLVGRIDEKIRPVALLIAIVILAGITHAVLIVAGLVSVLIGQERFKGSVAGAVNGFTGFAAWSLPIMIAAVVGTRIAVAHASFNPLLLLAIVIPMSLAFLIYFIAAVAAGYEISIGRAWGLLTIAYLLIFWIGKLVVFLLSTANPSP